MHRPTAPQTIRKRGGGAGRARKSRLIDMSNEQTFFGCHARFRDSISNMIYIYIYIFPSYVMLVKVDIIFINRYLDLFKVSFYYFVPW